MNCGDTTVVKLCLRQSPHIEVSDGKTLELAAQDAAIVTWLALESPTKRALLASLLWPQSQQSSALSALRQRLFQLRKQLGFYLLRGRTTLSLCDGVEHDLADAVTVLVTAQHDHSDTFRTWLTRQRGQRVVVACARLAASAEAAESDGRFDDAICDAGQLLALDFLSEAPHRRVIRLHYLRNDRSAALQARTLRC